MGDWRRSQTSPDGRYRIQEVAGDNDLYGADAIWRLIHVRSRKILWTFHGDITDSTVKSVTFSRNGRAVIAMNGYGKVVRRVDLAKIEEERKAEAARAGKKTLAGAGKRKKRKARTRRR